MNIHMPRKGFYSRKDKDIEHTEYIYSSGTTKGNFYYRPWTGHAFKWNTLLWNCVPRQAEMDEKYIYSEIQPDGTPPFNY